jgi:hypothetical protein
MITPQDELPRAGAGERFFDCVSIDFSEPERDLFGMVRITRFPNRDASTVVAVVFAGGEPIIAERAERDAPLDSWKEVGVNGVRMETTEPLERWRLALKRDDVTVDLNAGAVSPPLELAPPAEVGVEGYEQLCELSGTVDAGGRLHPFRGRGRRVHRWGVLDWGRLELWRSLYASAGEAAVLLVAVRPRGSAGHGEELRTVRLLEHGTQVELEDVRLSTVYGADGLPSKAGLELFGTGEELPRRVGGAAVGGASIDLGPERLDLSFFRWSLEGEPAFGCYETIAPR